jgi:myo-inositol 2-dehydrogenase / D-chiro-inositol 1-dehydrogenase
MNHSPIVTSTRRQFIKTSTAAGLALGTLVIPRMAHAVGGETVRVGLIGCGGRGTGAAMQAISADPNAQLTSLGDLFEDRLVGSIKSLKEQKPQQVSATPDSCFTGIDAYKKVIDSGVDVVVLTTPPHFRPAHIRAAITAGKHVFCEKPIAVDAPGVRSFLESTEMAKGKGLSIVSGFCWRYNFAERAAFERIHDGAVGDIQNIYSYYNTSGLWSHARKPEWTDMEFQIRNWLYYTWLSGDHLVEQAVHSVDKVGWAMRDKPPVRAIAQGGRQVRTDAVYGHIFDHFAVVYEWENGTRAFLNTRQQDGCASGVQDHIVGTKGVCNINSGNSQVIKGEVNWRYAGERNNMYQTEHDELFAAIRAGKPINDGVRTANSTMMAILGRMAAYTGQVITWDQAMESKEDLTPPSYDFGPIATPPVAMPGKTKFV